MSEQPTFQVNNASTADHDLLIKLDTKFDIFGKKLDDLSINLSGRVYILEKLAIQAQDIHKALEKTIASEKEDREAWQAESEKRGARDQEDIAFFKRWFWRIQGIFWIVQLIVSFYLLKHFGASL